MLPAINSPPVRLMVPVKVFAPAKVTVPALHLNRSTTGNSARDRFRPRDVCRRWLDIILQQYSIVDDARAAGVGTDKVRTLQNQRATVYSDRTAKIIKPIGARAPTFVPVQVVVPGPSICTPIAD